MVLSTAFFRLDPVRAAAAIDHGHALFTDDETNVGDFAAIVSVRQLMDTLMNMYARRDFLEGQILADAIFV